jgi:penicillin-binding protein 1C
MLIALAAFASGALFFWSINVWLFPLPMDRLFRDQAIFVQSRDGSLLKAFTSRDQFWRRSVKLEELSEKFVRTIITCEDRWFYYHPGINPISLISALVDNLRAGRVVRGGSTITMQIARMMEPKRRTVAGKLVEIFRALQLELAFSKKELLEIYFNIIPYGGNIEGAGAASLLYFDKGPDNLSVSEIAILAAIPVRPSEFRPDVDWRKCRERRNHVLSRMYAAGLISEGEYESAVEEEIPSERYSLPEVAPHFAQRMALEHPEGGIIRSTIDSRMQSACERLCRLHHSQLSDKNIRNLAVVVIDNKTAELLAMVGSADFGDRRQSGQVNGAYAPRSPGSALKPFIYALGFDSGLISPQLKIEDVPVSYAGYSPVNYDKEYHGVVSVTDALVNSLNVPAVNLTAEVGLRKFYDFLLSAGITTLKRKYYEYGLPLILGSGEVNLVELTNLYGLLARGGIYKDVRVILGREEEDSRRLLSEEACYLISDILSDRATPELPTCWEFTADMPEVAWKTGTSFGRRDAWTIGYNPLYTVGVWVGNFSGEGSVDIVGADVAAPLMFDIFNEIMFGREHVWFEVPDGLGVRKVSAVSGRPPNEFRTETIEEYYIPGVSPSGKCTITKKIYVDIHSGHRLSPDCLAGRDYDERIVQNWPPRIATWLAQRGIAAPVPPLDPDCRGMIDTKSPVITSPEKDARYIVVKHFPLEYQQILLEASSFSGNGKIHWFLDKRHYATVNSGEELFYTPEKGMHEVMCIDDQGHSSSIAFEVF